uniref:Uncharacterized protein n=1 Tax=Ictidomys tridecemlineatus TaxID=43179 RepID=A0A287DCG4_ICTTR
LLMASHRCAAAALASQDCSNGCSAEYLGEGGSKEVVETFRPSLGVKKPTKALLFVILSPVGPYFSSGTFNPVSLWANPKYVRAWKGGTGDCKMGGNYGSSLFAQSEAAENGCQQVLWLYGEDNQIEELATPPLDGIILPGVTRRCILDLAHKWGEFKVSERY